MEVRVLNSQNYPHTTFSRNNITLPLIACIAVFCIAMYIMYIGACACNHDMMITYINEGTSSFTFIYAS